jgi:hypothetical protein
VGGHGRRGYRKRATPRPSKTVGTADSAQTLKNFAQPGGQQLIKVGDGRAQYGLNV